MGSTSYLLSLESAPCSLILNTLLRVSGANAAFIHCTIGSTLYYYRNGSEITQLESQISTLIPSHRPLEVSSAWTLEALFYDAESSILYVYHYIHYSTFMRG
jgi:hypothetical protein